MEVEEVDVLVIGAGPSGTVAASIVHQNGLSVKIVEKQRFPRFVIGESLIPRVMDHLDEAGFIDAVDKVGFEKKYGAKFLKGDKICDFDFSKQYTEGWAWTWQLPRADFDKVLADKVEEMGVEIRYQTSVTTIDFEDDLSTTALVDQEGKESKIQAKFIIDASGYGRVIPRLLDLDKDSTLPPRSAIYTHVKDTNRPEGEAGTQITFVVQRQEVWFWIIPFSDGTTSYGVAGDPNYFAEFDGSNREVLAAMMEEEPHFRDRFRNVEMLFEPHLITAYSKGVKQLYGQGYALTGNSAEFLDPVFSSGVSFATESGALAAKLASRQIEGDTVDWENEYAEYIMQGVDTFRTYIKAWYDGSLQEIFFAPNVNPSIKEQICSVLAGYVWDMSNPFVRKHEKGLDTLVRVVRATARATT